MFGRSFQIGDQAKTVNQLPTEKGIIPCGAVVTIMGFQTEFRCSVYYAEFGVMILCDVGNLKGIVS